MKVRSPLADMDVVVGDVRRAGNDLVLTSGPGSSMEAIITVSAREVVATLLKVLTSPVGPAVRRRSAVVLVPPDARARVGARHDRLASDAADATSTSPGEGADRGCAR